MTPDVAVTADAQHGQGGLSMMDLMLGDPSGDVRDLRWRLTSLLERLLEDDPTTAAGAGILAERINPLKMAELANIAAGLARGVARNAVLDARARGHTWEQVGAALGLHADDCATLGEQAFTWAQDRDGWRTVGWRCSTCKERITDSGPFNPHPDDQEYGHAAGCSRHLGLMADYRRWLEQIDEA